MPSAGEPISITSLKSASVLYWLERFGTIQLWQWLAWASFSSIVPYRASFLSAEYQIWLELQDQNLFYCSI